MKHLTPKMIQNLPKVELHRHVDGAVDPNLVLQLAKKEGIKLPKKIKYQPQNLLRIRRGMSVDDIMVKFNLVIDVMQSEKNIELVFHNQVLDLARENIVYAELRFAPQYHLKRGLTLHQVVWSAILGVKWGMEVCRRSNSLPKVEVRIILCIAREGDIETAKRVAMVAIEFEKYGVVGIDLACNEADYPPELHTEAFQLTLESGIMRTAHAGEFGNQRLKNIATALKLLDVHRLGHAVGITKSPALLRFCRENKVGIEICPLSVLTCGNISSFQELELDVLKKEGVLFNISSDDPTMFCETLSQTLYNTAKIYKWSLRDLQELMRNSLRIAFLPEEKKQELTEKWFWWRG